jgi:hypothetical protein
MIEFSGLLGAIAFQNPPAGKGFGVFIFVPKCKKLLTRKRSYAGGQWD